MIPSGCEGRREKQHRLCGCTAACSVRVSSPSTIFTIGSFPMTGIGRIESSPYLAKRMTEQCLA